MDHEVSTQPKARITPEEYLALERTAETRSEYLDGEMFLMSGTTKEHTQITRNITVELTLQFKHKPCELFPLEMRTKVSATGLYTYPDIAVVCGEPEFEDANFDTLLNPTLIIEVLSDSTESYDRGRKFAHYRNIPSLREYVLVSQWERRIEKFSRTDDGSWTFTESADPEGSIELSSAGGNLTLSNVYDRVDLERAKQRRARQNKP
jgi:Uma2 family endonuclease